MMVQPPKRKQIENITTMGKIYDIDLMGQLNTYSPIYCKEDKEGLIRKIN